MSEPDFAMPGHDGPVIPKDAHIRIVHPTVNDGVRMLRRGYNFVDGSNALGGLDAGLFFIAFVRDPRTPVRAGDEPDGASRTRWWST